MAGRYWLIVPLVLLAGLATGWGAGYLLKLDRLAAEDSAPLGAAAAAAAVGRTSLAAAAAVSAAVSTSGSASVSAPVAVAATATAMASGTTAKPKKRKKRRMRHTEPAPEFYYEPTVEVADGPGKRIIVSQAQRRLFLYDGEELVKTFRVAIGRHAGSTPTGNFRIISKAHNPAWNYKGKHVPGGSAANPLGKWWMALSVTHRSGTRFGIHGTNAPWSIGKRVSRGCIRMYNKDAATLYRLVSSGTPVTIQ